MRIKGLLVLAALLLGAGHTWALRRERNGLAVWCFVLAGLCATGALIYE